MLGFLLWCLLFVICWPLALLALIAYPFVWLILLPFRILGVAVHGALALVRAMVMLLAVMTVRRRRSHRGERGRTECGRRHGQPELSSLVTQLCSPLASSQSPPGGAGRPSCLYTRGELYRRRTSRARQARSVSSASSSCRDELVAGAADGHQPLRLGRVALDLPAQVRDVHLARVLVADVLARPEVLHQLAA